MRYLALLGSDESAVPAPGTPERDAIHAGYVRFAQTRRPTPSSPARPLQPVATARTVRHGDGGEPLVTDGPYAETAEALGGFYVLEADTLDDAIALAREIPTPRTAGSAVRPAGHVAGRPDGTAARARRHLALIYGKESRRRRARHPRVGRRGGRARPLRRGGGHGVVAGGAAAPDRHHDHRAGARRRAAGDRRAVQRDGRGGRRVLPPGRRPTSTRRWRWRRRSPSAPAGRSRCARWPTWATTSARRPVAADRGARGERRTGGGRAHVPGRVRAGARHARPAARRPRGRRGRGAGGVRRGAADLARPGRARPTGRLDHDHRPQPGARPGPATRRGARPGGRRGAGR